MCGSGMAPYASLVVAIKLKREGKYIHNLPYLYMYLKIENLFTIRTTMYCIKLVL